jgi:excinuclease UvrABC nuclease subunit
MGKAKVKYNKTEIEQLPNDKPVLYRIETEGGNLNYVGVAKRGRVRERITEHLGEIPGATVKVEQFSSIQDARKKEANVIRRNQPKYNKQDQ